VQLTPKKDTEKSAGKEDRREKSVAWYGLYCGCKELILQ
jgi:hypothetical protein